MIQHRPRDGSDSRWYNPNRDLAYNWQHLSQAALDQLATTNWKPWFKEYFEFARVTEADIGAGAEALAKFFQFVCHPDVDGPRKAFEMAGWFELKPAVQVALWMKLGQVATMAFFSAIRDVTPDSDAPPLDMAGLLDSARKANFELTGDRRWVRWLKRRWAYLRLYVWPFNRGPKAG